MLKRLVLPVLLVLVSAIAAGGALGARPSPPLLCEAAKLRAAGKNAFRQLVCCSKAYRRETAPSTVPAPRCMWATTSKFIRAFVKAERKGPCAGNGATLADAVDLCAARIAAEVPQPGKCQALKLKAAAKKAARRLACFARGITDTRGSFSVSGCLAATDVRFSALFDRAESRGECSGRKTSLAEAIDGCIDALQNLSPTTTTTQAPVTATTSSTSSTSQAPTTTTTSSSSSTTTSSTTATTHAPTTTTTSSTTSTTQAPDDHDEDDEDDEDDGHDDHDDRDDQQQHEG